MTVKPVISCHAQGQKIVARTVIVIGTSEKEKKRKTIRKEAQHDEIATVAVGTDLE